MIFPDMKIRDVNVRSFYFMSPQNPSNGKVLNHLLSEGEMYVGPKSKFIRISRYCFYSKEKNKIRNMEKTTNDLNYYVQS